MIHIYFGDGKGKTTAALGLLLRAAGSGRVCALVQFLKDFPCGELKALEKLGVPVFRGKAPEQSFAKDMTPEQLERTRIIHGENLRLALQAVTGRGDALLVLDEALDALQLGLADENAIRSLLEAPPEGLEIVLTGHNRIEWLEPLADYITEMKKCAHPYDRGVMARKGVEF